MGQAVRHGSPNSKRRKRNAENLSTRPFHHHGNHALIPGLGGNQVQGVTTGDWLTMLNDQFGMTTYVSQDPYYADIDASNPYFEAVQIAYEWGVINDADAIDVDANVTHEFVAMTLVRVALLEVNKPAPIKNASKLAAPEEVAVAAAWVL
jgi:hypothetical protein